MKVHLNKIPPEGVHLEGEEPQQVLDLHDPGVRPLSGVRHSLDIGLSDGGLFATGILSVDLELECVTCVEKFHYDLEVNDFACQIELGTAETVDLTEPIREDIVLALPPHPHCDWNGERVCPGIARLKEVQAAADSLPEEPAVWGALDQLNLKKT
ncbi:MAG TPA: hypothetical protein VF593_09760 [Chthoniobacteraceae bacterium]|jgi:uncharacterized metal-binding protein YceD (DUF177 family)